jgi:phage shock protein PspC (stress-responsive transcriptional regulator)
MMAPVQDGDMTTNVAPNSTVTRLQRGDGPVGGVAAGLADYLNTDPTLIRLGLVVATLVGGPVIPACYLAAWIIIPPGGEVPIAPVAGSDPTPPSAHPPASSAT